jgi:hypothetical protein
MKTLAFTTPLAIALFLAAAAVLTSTGAEVEVARASVWAI